MLVAGGLGIVEDPLSEHGQGEAGANGGNIRPDPDGDPLQDVSLHIGLLEHVRHNVIVGVSLLLELLGVCLGEGEEAGHVVHHLLAAVLSVHDLLPRLAKLGEEQWGRQWTGNIWKENIFSKCNVMNESDLSLRLGTQGEWAGRNALLES